MLKGLKVLLVEDEGTVSMLIEEFLENLGCELAGSATRLDEAMEMARTVDADVAVVDVNLAGELSYPAAQYLRSGEFR